MKKYSSIYRPGVFTPKKIYRKINAILAWLLRKLEPVAITDMMYCLSIIGRDRKFFSTFLSWYGWPVPSSKNNIELYY
jgi:hypothetical protein